jgi:hypothetical protein
MDMGKKNAKAAKAPHAAPDPYLLAIRALVWESNQFLLTLYGVQRLRPLPLPPGWPGVPSKATQDQWDADNPNFTGTLLANGGLLLRLKSWFDRIDAAYAPAASVGPAPGSIRSAVLDLAGEVQRPEYAGDPPRSLITQVRSWPGLFLRKFEAKLLVLEREVAVVAAAAHASPGAQQTVQPCWRQAMDSFNRAVNAENGPEPRPLKKVYKWLTNHDGDGDYDLPDFNTWTKYIREYKKATTGEIAASSRSGRTGGRSIQRLANR